MHTVNLRIACNGALLLCHPGAKPGADHLIYAVRGVPDDVAPAAVQRQADRICMVGSSLDPAHWSINWADIAGKPQGYVLR